MVISLIVPFLMVTFTFIVPPQPSPVPTNLPSAYTASSENVSLDFFLASGVLVGFKIVFLFFVTLSFPPYIVKSFFP